MKSMKSVLLLLVVAAMSSTASAQGLESEFGDPPKESHPETWFHLISGNVSKPFLTTDLEAIADAGIQGIQLFHGKGQPWPGVTPQIETLSPRWDDMISHVADETQRLGLRFTMQNCPGWAMSGGPWITPDKAMRHLVWSRVDVTGGANLSIDLPQPALTAATVTDETPPDEAAWRDYRDIAVLAFPTPMGDHDAFLKPVEVISNRQEQPWLDVIEDKKNVKVQITPDNEPTWVEFTFAKQTHLRSIELPPVELLMKRRNFDPDARVRLEAFVDGSWLETSTRVIPRGTWQDSLNEFPLTLAFADVPSRRFRLTFDSTHPMELSYLRLSSAARVNDWRGQAGYALRSLQRSAPPVQDPATWLKREALIDLSDQFTPDAALSWNAPMGDWTILRFGHVNTGVKNKPAPPEATGFECDKLSPAGAEQHFAGYIGRLSAPGGPADQGRLQGMLIDSWECFTQTWTPAMEREFAGRRGYALRQHLPTLAGYVMEDQHTSERFLRDWRKTISDMLVENYFGRLANLARQRGMQLSFETAIGDVSPGDILQYFGKADIPMCEFWKPNDPHWGGFEAKPIQPTASAAHIYGKTRVAAEAFTDVGHRWNDHPFTMKHLADRHYTLGVNQLVFHTYTHNPLDRIPGTSFGGRIGTPFLRGQTWWRQMPLFTDYLARCQLMLQQGQPVADVLWYLGDDVDHKPMQSRPFPQGYAFDYLNQDALLNRIDVVDGMLQNPEGTTWKFIWLPEEDCQRLTAETLAQIHELLESGATVVGRAPTLNPSLSGGEDSESDFTKFVKALWGDHPSDKGDRKIGKGRLIWGDELVDVFGKLGITPDVTGCSASSWCHRHTQDAEIYFVAAARKASLEANLRFRAQGRPEFWDPLTGMTEPIAMYSRDGQHTVVPIKLPAAGSMFVVFRRGDEAPVFTRIERNGKPLVDATDRTKVEQTEPASIFGLTKDESVQPWVEPPVSVAELMDGGNRLLAWENGEYQLRKSDGTSLTRTVGGCTKLDVTAPWSLSFPSGWDTPPQIELTELKPWSALSDPATRSFSGTATYNSYIDLDEVKHDAGYLIDLGRVADIARVVINDKPVTTLWAPPFTTDISKYVRAGRNSITIEVTNTWHNRLVYDARLEPGKQKTWTIGGPQKDAPLEPAGLMSPIVIRIGQVVDFNS